jgi:pSer/pThr/pTyr-binding forkhead associated (FHA) protein
MAATARNLERIIMSIHSYPAPHLIPTIDHAGITTVGRHADCDIVIPDTTMSRRHAVFHHLGDAISVTDLDSFNGTYVNRRIVNQAALADGDEIWIGKLRLILDWVSPPGAQVLSITRVHEVTCPRTGSTRCPLDAASMHSASS